MNETNLLEDQPIAWTPTPEIIERAQLTKFMRQVGVSTWDELYAYSINDVEMFTAEVLRFLDIKFDPPYEKLLDTSDGIEFPKWFQRSADTPVRMSAKHEHDASINSNVDETSAYLAGGTGDADKSVRTPSAGLNITEMCLDRWQTDEMKEQPAVIWEGENGSVETLSYETLMREVEYCSGGLRMNGISKGDAVAIHLPMIVETVVALIAIGRIGAIAVPVFSGYGVEAIASRINAVGAKALVTCDGFARRGKVIDAKAIGLEAVKRCPTIEHVFTVYRISEPEVAVVRSQLVVLKFTVDSTTDSGKRNIPVREHTWKDLLGVECKQEGDYYPFQRQSLRKPEPTSAEDPLIILYTSGTTGKPKGIAHTHASFPIKAAQDMAFGTDVGKGTRISWYTDIGWMMGPWLIYGALINGATICIYDGAPDYPTPDRMWEFCAKHKVEVLGISPTLIRSLAAGDEAANSPPYEGGVADPTPFVGTDGVVLAPPDEVVDANAENHPTAKAAPLLRKEGSKKMPFERHDLSSLRIFASTGEPWNPAPWWWLFEKVGNSKLPIINYSGGTEISGGILMGNMLLPQKPCSFPAPCPGMDVDILDEEGNSVEPGKVGELVIKQPWIGMARGFWQEKERYLDTYWRRFKNIWVHGDFAMRDKDNYWFILGRSDDTLKVAGKRVGPAEVESLLVAHPLVTEAAVIGVPDDVKGTAMVAFVVMNKEYRISNIESTENEDSTFEIRNSKFEIELKALVAKDMGKPLAPSKIHFVSALPKTRNAKVMRRVIRSAYLGEDPGDLSALENPQTVTELQELTRC